MTPTVMVQTSKGPMAVEVLEKKEGPGWVEYWLEGELVHRSSIVDLGGVKSTGHEGDAGGGPRR